MNKSAICVFLTFFMISCGSYQEDISKKVIDPITGNIKVVVSSEAIINIGIVEKNKPDSIKSIKDITSLKELELIHPTLADFSGANTTKFIELQKNQLLLGLQMSAIQDESYLVLKKELENILQCKEIWSEKIAVIAKEFEESLKKRKIPNGSIDENFKILLDEKNQAMREFQSSKECLEYVQSRQSRLIEIDESMQQYYPPEVLETQKSIKNLNAEVYGNNIIDENSRNATFPSLP